MHKTLTVCMMMVGAPKRFLFVASIGLVCLVSGTCAAEPVVNSSVNNLAFHASEVAGQYGFDTGFFAGLLHRGGSSQGLGPVRCLPGESELSGRYGLLSYYRVLTSETRYGHAAWEWPSRSELLADGSVRTIWPATEGRPLEIEALYTWRAENTIDLVTRVTAHQSLPRLEIFLASYFHGFPESLVYVREHPQREQKPGFLEANKGDGKWQAFPRDKQAVEIIRDGRWQRPPSPVQWAIRPRLAAPLAMRRDKETGLTALVMAREDDCFAVLTPHGEEGHRSMYLSLFGKTLEPGQSVRATVRMIIDQNISAVRAIELYKQFLAEVSASKSDESSANGKTQ